MKRTPRRSPAAPLLCLLFFLLPAARAGILRSNRVLLLCHRTANRDLPENTLADLALAARMGCDIVEVDVRRTADGTLVLNHDGLLDRFTDTTGDVEDTDLRELDRMDFGAWMGGRFRDMPIAHLDDALRLARELRIGLDLDIKTKGIGSQVLAMLADEGMARQVIFGGEWDDMRQLDPAANPDLSAGVQPGLTQQDVQALHAQHKIVIANFILNGHEFDLDGMRHAVALGVDGIMVDYPRLGAEAVGRPVEKKIAELTQSAESGPPDQRVHAIRALSEFVGFPLQPLFLHWLLSGDERVSHQAALALVIGRPSPPLSALEPALHSASPVARSNAAWTIGALSRDSPDARCASFLVPLLRDPSTEVLQQALVGLACCPVTPQAVPVPPLEALLTGELPVLRGLAAVALAKHHPEIAESAVPAQLEKEVKHSDAVNAAWTARGRPPLSQPDIDKAVEIYRAQMKELQAIALLPGKAALASLSAQAFRPGHDYSIMPILVAGFRLWDRLADDPAPALAALHSPDRAEADWAEWALVKAGPRVLPVIRQALPMSQGDWQRRLIEILGWQADQEALPLLRPMEKTHTPNQESIRRAIAMIEAFHPPHTLDGARQAEPIPGEN